MTDNSRKALDVANSLSDVVRRLSEDVYDHNLRVRVVRAEELLREYAAAEPRTEVPEPHPVFRYCPVHTAMSHPTTAEKFARVIAKVYEPDLDWDNPAEYDLLDRGTLTEQAQKILDRLKWDGFVVQELDDLALDEFDNAPKGRVSGERMDYEAGYSQGFHDGLSTPRGSAEDDREQSPIRAYIRDLTGETDAGLDELGGFGDETPPPAAPDA